MESVKRYCAGDLFASGQMNAHVVRAEDFERVTTTLEQRRYAEQQAREAAERRVEDLGARISETSAKLELAASMMDDDVRGNRFAEVCRLAISALNPTAEAESHE